MRPPRFERRPAPSPSFNHGWRLGVAVGASALIWLLLAVLLGLIGKVWNAYF